MIFGPNQRKKSGKKRKKKELYQPHKSTNNNYQNIKNQMDWPRKANNPWH